MKLNARVAAIGAALLLIAPLVSCSTGSPEAKNPDVEPAPTAEVKKEEPKTSERGNLIKKVGEPAGISQEDNPDENVVDFVVTGITVDPECTGVGASTYPSDRGHFVRIDMEVSTSPNLNGDFWADGSAWKWIDVNGVTMNGNPGSLAAAMCVPDDQKLPGNIGPGEKASGAVVVDVANTEGTLVFLGGMQTGWEWAVPAL